MFVDAIWDKTSNVIKVVERNNGLRVFKEYPADYHFYVSDQYGTHKNIFGDPVKKISPKSFEEKHKQLKRYTNTWEADMNPIMRCLEQNYLGQESPKLHTAFFDIEVDFDPDHGYCTPTEATNKITSISIYMDWLKQMVCFAIPPPTLTDDEADAIAATVPDVILCNSEMDMLEMFMAMIEDADVLSGWNSEFYDLPYIINRIQLLYGDDSRPMLRKLCLWDQKPTVMSIDRGGKEEFSYTTIGRIHLDYMQLYKKYAGEVKLSYSLNSIAIDELGTTKVEYSGTLDQLYKNDFKLFLEYNIQDTKLLHDLDTKLQYVDLANSIAHMCLIPIPSTQGAVVTTESAIVVDIHRLGMVAPNKKRFGKDSEVDNRAAGGWVSNPKKGFHEWVAASDLNSLYPSAIRALNMSPETIVGQILHEYTDETIHAFEKKGGKFADWWNDRFSTLEMENYFNKNDENLLTLVLESGERVQLTGLQLHNLVFSEGSNLCISANGTLFKTDVIGIIPGLLGRWFDDRKVMQGLKKGYDDLLTDDPAKCIKVPDGMFDKSDIDHNIPAANPFSVDTAFRSPIIRQMIDNGDDIREYVNAHRLTVVDGALRSFDVELLESIISFWDKRQLVAKILLNSLYGGLLNEGHRFFDKRLGQSTTLTGRNITKHMSAKTNELFTGIYDHEGETAIYQDTDSNYFTGYNAMKPMIENGDIVWNKENVIELYDKVSSTVSDTFPQFMLDTFNCPLDKGKVIKSSREIVAETSLFIKKKRYAALVIDKEGKRQDVSGTGKIKVTGLDLRRSDTPKVVQEFLMKVLTMVLHRKEEHEVIEVVRAFKKEFTKLPSWEKGTPKAVNNLTKYRDKEEASYQAKIAGESTKNVTVPGHVRGALNWNDLLDRNQDKYTIRILDGSKIKLAYLKLTSNNTMTNIAYPVDEEHLPVWFTSLPFDDARMEEAVVDKKVSNLLSVLGWDLSRTSEDSELFETLFEF